MLVLKVVQLDEVTVSVAAVKTAVVVAKVYPVGSERVLESVAL